MIPLLENNGSVFYSFEVDCREGGFETTYFDNLFVVVDAGSPTANVSVKLWVTFRKPKNLSFHVLESSSKFRNVNGE